MVVSVHHERAHENIAYEIFYPEGPFAILPMLAGEDGRPRSAIVWSVKARDAAATLGLPDRALAHEIEKRMGGFLGAIELAGPRWNYPLGFHHAATLTAERLALVGDAAHGIHPIAGQGLNLGFRDAAALAEAVITAVGSGADPGAPALLRRYQAARRPANLLMLAATDGLDRLFSTDNPLIRAARDLGIGAVHRIPPLKRIFMRQAMGPERHT
jgi:2-octaprenyl-6-methoxyphenol hydroxylase